MRPVIVYGPQACGKTTNAQALAQAYGCTSVVDDWTPGEPIPAGALALTNVPGVPAAIPFAEAMERVRA